MEKITINYPATLRMNAVEPLDPELRALMIGAAERIEELQAERVSLRNKAVLQSIKGE